MVINGGRGRSGWFRLVSGGKAARGPVHQVPPWRGVDPVCVRTGAPEEECHQAAGPPRRPRSRGGRWSSACLRFAASPRAPLVIASACVRLGIRSTRALLPDQRTQGPIIEPASLGLGLARTGTCCAVDEGILLTNDQEESSRQGAVLTVLKHPGLDQVAAPIGSVGRGSLPAVWPRTLAKAPLLT